MIILDTNVLSAVMQKQPDTTIVSWLDGQPTESIWLTTITVFEVRFGIELLAPGRRRRRLDAAFETSLVEELGGRVLAFDQPAAETAARIAAELRTSGRPPEIRDVAIAGITAARSASLATRNIRHFENLGIPLIDPWGEATARS